MIPAIKLQAEIKRRYPPSIRPQDMLLAASSLLSLSIKAGELSPTQDRTYTVHVLSRCWLAAILMSNLVGGTLDVVKYTTGGTNRLALGRELIARAEPLIQTLLRFVAGSGTINGPMVQDHVRDYVVTLNALCTLYGVSVSECCESVDDNLEVVLSSILPSANAAAVAPKEDCGCAGQKM